MKNLKAVLVAFVLLLTVTVVYAAGESLLSIQGTARLTDVKLEFTASLTSTTGLTNVIPLSVILAEVNDEVTEDVFVRNTGKLPAVITDIKVYYGTSNTAPTTSTVISVTHTITADTIDVGGENGLNNKQYTITVKRLVADATLLDYDFLIEIEYAEAT